MNGPEPSNRPMPIGDRWRMRRTGDGVSTAAFMLGTIGCALMLAACAASVRPGPMVDAASPAPFATADGPTPTQAQAQAAIDAAVRRDGLPGVFPQFGALAPGRVPTRVTLFACGSAGGDTVARGRVATGVWATCHVDVLDGNGDLLGRTTMRFVRRRSAWVLADDRERELDAR